MPRDQDKPKENTLVKASQQEFLPASEMSAKEKQDSEFYASMEAIIEMDDDLGFIEMARAVGIDPKKDLVGSPLAGAEFVDGDDFFQGADLRGANLQGSKWQNTALPFASIQGTDFTDAQGLVEEDFLYSHFDETTKFPANIDVAKLVKMQNDLNAQNPSIDGP